MKHMLIKLLLLCGLLCLIYYFGCGILIRFDTAQLWLWVVLGADCFALAGLIALGHRLGWHPPRWFRAGVWSVFALCAAAALTMMGMVAARMTASAPAGLDYLIVLGARVNGETPSGALLHRIESAAAYSAENPDTLIIASGGQGEDEAISEAECIRRTLIAMGVDESRIIIEDQSTSTHENMVNSLALMDSPETARIGVVTNNFHVYRAERLARYALPGEVHGMSAEFTWILLPHYLVRESACSVVDALEGHMTLFD